MIKDRVAVVVFVAFLALGGLAKAEEREVVVPEDTVPFKVGQSDYVRLTGTGISGSRIVIKVQGAAKVAATASISLRHNGHPEIGGERKEFDLKPTGVGRVKATISVTSPQPGSEPKETVYEFTVQ